MVNKKTVDNQKYCIKLRKIVNGSVSALDKEHTQALPSTSVADTEIQVSKIGDFTKQNSLNFVKALIQIIFERGEINKATYERAVKKLTREAEKHGGAK